VAQKNVIATLGWIVFMDGLITEATTVVLIVDYEVVLSTSVRT